MPATTLLMLPPQTKLTHQWAERLALDVPDVSVIVAEDAGKAARAIAEADCAFGTLPRGLLPAATRLRWLQAPQAAPPAGWYYPELIAHPMVVTNFREIYNDHIGAHIMAFVLAFARGLHEYLPRQLNRERFQRMKRTACFITTGRGMTTRLDDLVAALTAGEIAGAGLDVFEQEPLPATHPLWTMPGVLITPHTAGYGPYLDDRRYEILRDNCQRFLAGQPLRNVVDKTSWF